MAATLILLLNAASALRTPRLAVGRDALRTPQHAVIGRDAADAHCRVWPPSFVSRSSRVSV